MHNRELSLTYLRQESKNTISFSLNPITKLVSLKKLRLHHLVKENSENNLKIISNFSWKMSQISKCTFFENSKSTDVIVDKYLTRMLDLA